MGITIVRVLSLIPAAYFGMLAFKLRPFQDRPWSFGSEFFFAFSALAVQCLWFSALGHRQSHRTIIGCSFVTAAALGQIGVIVGMVFQMIASPTSNIAPILGIFQTGPICFGIGACVGIGVGVALRHMKEAQHPARGDAQ